MSDLALFGHYLRLRISAIGGKADMTQTRRYVRSLGRADALNDVCCWEKRVSFGDEPLLSLVTQADDRLPSIWMHKASLVRHPCDRHCANAWLARYPALAGSIS
jgi:hypothetical protein